MNPVNPNLNSLIEVNERLIGQRSWGVSLGIGSFLTVNFGSPTKPIRESKTVLGEWYLWVRHSAWRILNNRYPVIGSEDSREILKTEVPMLNNLVLSEIVITPTSFDTDFVFEGRITLQLFPVIYKDEYTHWELYTPDNKVLTLGPGLSWSYKD
jgi:hypothetical protein